MNSSGVDLLVYADRLGGDLRRLADLLDGPLRDFSGVHILPFYRPFDGVDAGFDPIDHSAVDDRLGDWEDVRRIARDRGVTADLIVNHVSSGSEEFVDWLARGRDSEHDGMFLTFDTVFPHGASAADITAFYRPRPGLPFTSYRAEDGSRKLVWTTFMPTQVDLDVHHPKAMEYIDRVLDRLATSGVTTVRLDAVGYAVKTAGSDSFMTAATLEFTREITRRARDRGLRVLVEVHAHHSQQLAIAPLVDLVYDFALPALLLHSFGVERVDRLTTWLEMRPTNAVTVLDTHDGIGVIDAGPSRGLPGLIDEAEMASIFERATVATSGLSAIASVVPEWATMPHQINATFLSVLGADATRYLIARAVQFFVPGTPQIYYVGLLGGLDDVALFERTGQGRDVNRHRYAPDELEAALATPLTRALLGLVRLRTSNPAFAGSFSFRAPAEHLLELDWRTDEHAATLTVDVSTDPRFAIILRDRHGTRTIDGVDGLHEE